VLIFVLDGSIESISIRDFLFCGITGCTKYIIMYKITEVKDMIPDKKLWRRWRKNVHENKKYKN